MAVFGRRDDPPDETLPFFTTTDATRFRTAVAAEFARHGIHVIIDATRARTPSGPSFGLYDLAARCHAAGRRRSAWRPLIGEHVRVAVRAARQPHPVHTATQTQLEHHARLRLWDTARFDPTDRTRYHYAREALPGVLELLVYDDEHCVLPLTDAHLERFDAPAVHAAALHNLLLEPVDEHTELTTGLNGATDGTHIQALFGQSYYVGSKALVLRHVLSTLYGDRDYPLGALTAAPGRHTLYLHVIESAAVLPTLATLAHLAQARYHDEPGALSPHVYWWNGTTLTPVTHHGTIQIEPGSPFEHALDAATRHTP